MNPRRRPYAVLLQLAFVATLLMALAPLVSRWQQAQGDPVMLMPGGMAHVMPAAAPVSAAMTEDASMAHHHGMHHAGMHHDMPGQGTTVAEDARPAAPASPSLDPHAGHGEACEYCMMASRLMPWLAVLLVLLPALPVIAPPVLRRVRAPHSLPWPAHAARGPPLNA